MFVSLDMTLACCFICAAIGYVAPMICRRLLNRKAPCLSKSETLQVVNPSASVGRIDSLLHSLFDLTSQVEVQVGQHSLRINEITDSFESPGEIGSAVILVAGKMLISANQKLQSDLEEAKQEIQRQRDLMSSCVQESRTDALTCIPNRRALDHELVRAFAERRRNRTAFSVLIIDVDHFKRVNDQYGHMVGDQLLKYFSRSLTQTFRETDFVARFGGEEFVAILPKISLGDACKAAERVRNVIETSRHKIGDLELQVTASIGVKEFEEDDTEAEILEKADKALYAAKNNGRNCCYFHDGSQCQRIVPDTVLNESDEDSQCDSIDETIVDDSDYKYPLRSRQLAEKVLAEMAMQ